MLGQFLEFSVSARPVAAALAFYRGLGFQSVEVGDIVTTPYAVIAAPDVAIGLHERDLEGPVPTFVRPELSAHTKWLRRVGIELEFSRLADDQFHQVGFVDPNARLVMLLEARTFSAGSWGSGNVSVCGDFVELSVPTRSVEESESFWGKLGCAVIASGEKPWPWRRVAGHGAVIGFHQTAPFPAGLTFHARDLAARLEYLKAKGFAPVRGAPVIARDRPAATLIAPEGTAIYLLEP